MHIRRREERGFTIVELLIAVVIEAILVAGLGTALIVTIKGATSVDQSFDRSGDARIAANYVISDARNSSGPEVTLGTSTCTDAHPPVTGTATPIVEFSSTSTSSTGVDTDHVVGYLLAGNSLLRRECQGTSTVSTSDRVVASNVASVTVACAPTANCSGSPTSITATVNSVADSGGNVYSYKLTGAFRKLGGSGAPPAPPGGGPAQSVILLGASGTCSGTNDTVNVSGSAFVRVYGAAYLNTTDGPSCNAMEVSGSGTWTAGKTNIFTGGTCKSPGSWLPCPTVTAFSPRVADPYASMTAPTTTGLPTRTGCSGAQASQTASPGLYSSGFDLGGGNTCTLATGIYVVQGGFHVGNGATLKTATGGVLIYLLSGAFAIDGGSTITLTAMSTGSYSGLSVWQAAADTQTMTFSNGGALVFNGAIYAPKAELNISGNAQTPIVTALVVQSIVASGSGGITIGSPLTITAPTSLPNGTATVTYPTTASTGSGGGGTYTWSATGLPTGLSINATTGDITGTPTVSGTFSVTITLNDSAGDAAASSVLGLTIKPAIVSVALGNKTGGTAGTIEQGDTVTIVYSSAMKVTTFCSTWSGDTTNQALNADNLVTVAVSNGTSSTNDVLTVTTASGCTFNLGSIDLGANAYDSVAATFKGASTNKSTIAWTASTKTLVITLGAKTAGTLANVASSAPIYTASGSLQDTSGLALGNSPFTLAAAKQF